MNRRRFVQILAPLVALLLATACHGGTETSTPARPAKTDHILVFAAASLKDVFTRLGGDFQKAHPGTEVTFNFAGSQELRIQIEQGAAADVLASADRKTMDTLQTAG